MQPCRLEMVNFLRDGRQQNPSCLNCCFNSVHPRQEFTVQESIDAVKQISSAQTLYALQSRLRAQQKAQEELRAAALTAPQQRTQAQVGTLLVLSHHHRRQPPTTTLLRAASRADNASCHQRACPARQSADSACRHHSQ